MRKLPTCKAGERSTDWRLRGWCGGCEMAKNILAWNEKAQQFYREIGKCPNGKPHRFYLTDDERAARAKVVRLEGGWQGVKDRWNNHHADDLADTVMPLWDDTTIQIGTA